MQTKKFNGKTYTKLSTHHLKRDAVANAKREREINHLARITKEFTGWTVWFKKKSPYG